MIRHYSSIIFTCHPFQPSPISLLRVGNTFLTSSPFDVSKLQQQKILDVSLTGSFPFPMSMDTHILIPYQWGLSLDLNGIEGVIIHLSAPESYGFDNIISE